MAEKDGDGLVDSVSQSSARFDRLESLVTECLTREKPAIGQCAASAAEDHDNAGRRRVVDLTNSVNRRRVPSLAPTVSYRVNFAPSKRACRRLSCRQIL